MGIEMRNSSNSRSYLCMIKPTHLSDEPENFRFPTYSIDCHDYRFLTSSIVKPVMSAIISNAIP